MLWSSLKSMSDPLLQPQNVIRRGLNLAQVLKRVGCIIRGPIPGSHVEFSLGVRNPNRITSFMWYLFSLCIFLFFTPLFGIPHNLPCLEWIQGLWGLTLELQIDFYFWGKVDSLVVYTLSLTRLASLNIFTSGCDRCDRRTGGNLPCSSILPILNYCMVWYALMDIAWLVNESKQIVKYYWWS